MTKKKLLLGAHLSIAGGYEQALIKGEQIGCTALQIFTKSNRQWASKPITAQQALLFKETQKRSSCQIVLAHASYLINIGSSDNALKQKSIVALQDELGRCSMLGIPFLVLHPGVSKQSESAEESLFNAGQTLSYVLKHDTSQVRILLENTAGQGASLGSTFEELAIIAQQITSQDRIGFCFDTCHAFAAGYDFSNKKFYTQMWKQFDTVIGLERLKAIHCNDSVKGLNSKVDRHAHIGQGTIGIEAFKLLMNDEHFSDIPKIIETPKSTTDLSDDIKNISLLKNLLVEGTE